MAPPVGTLVCPGCGGAVPRTAGACAYCGAVLVLPPPLGANLPAQLRTFCPRCATLYPAAAGRCPSCPGGPTDERGGHCPRCAADLEPTALGNVTVDRCPACKGTWFDGDELEHTMDLTTQGIGRSQVANLRRALPQTTLGLEEVHYLACVRCGERMARRQVAARTGLIVDICRSHGVWFDGGELEHFRAFVAAGGLEVLRHEDVAQAEANRLRAAAAEAAAPHGPSPWRPTPSLDPWMGGHLLDDLWRLLRAILGR